MFGLLRPCARGGTVQRWRTRPPPRGCMLRPSAAGRRRTRRCAARCGRPSGKAPGRGFPGAGPGRRCHGWTCARTAARPWKFAVAEPGSRYAFGAAAAGHGAAGWAGGPGPPAPVRRARGPCSGRIRGYPWFVFRVGNGPNFLDRRPALPVVTALPVRRWIARCLAFSTG